MITNLPIPEDYRFTETGLGLSLIKKSNAITNPSRHFHPWWEIMYIVSGERTFFYANRTFHITAGTFLCIAPGVLHRAINPADEVCHLYNVYFSDSGNATPEDDFRMKMIIPLLDKTKPCTVLSAQNQDRVTDLFSKMGKEIFLSQSQITSEADSQKASSDTQAMVWSLLCEMLVTVLRQEKWGGDGIQTTDAMNGHLAPILDYLNTHYCESLSLEEVSSKFGITPSHLSRSFKLATRFGFVEYINSLRVSESCRLLRNSSLSVLEIALKCGFGSVTQFGRCFKELTGVSPRVYRKK